MIAVDGPRAFLQLKLLGNFRRGLLCKNSFHERPPNAMPRTYFKDVDGNAVLAAHSTDDASESNSMARYSPVFAHIFSLPSAEDMETYDGVLFACMADIVKDLQKLLDALHCQPPFALVPFNPDTPSLSLTRPDLALSTKYESLAKTMDAQKAASY